MYIYVYNINIFDNVDDCGDNINGFAGASASMLRLMLFAATNLPH